MVLVLMLMKVKVRSNKGSELHVQGSAPISKGTSSVLNTRAEI